MRLSADIVWMKDFRLCWRRRFVDDRRGKELLVDVSPLKQPKDFSRDDSCHLPVGYIPVLMQPERSLYWGTEDYLHLRESGCRLMLNLYSLFGYNGDGALNCSRMLLLKRVVYISLFGQGDTTTVIVSMDRIV